MTKDGNVAPLEVIAGALVIQAAAAMLQDRCQGGFVRDAENTIVQAALAKLRAEHPAVIDVVRHKVAACALAAAPRDPHSIIHMPTDPSCEICKKAKLEKARAFRNPDPGPSTATEFGERMHIDLMGPTKPTIHGQMYLLVVRDDATDYPYVAPLPSKRPADVRNALAKLPPTTAENSRRSSLAGWQ